MGRFAARGRVFPLTRPYVIGHFKRDSGLLLRRGQVLLPGAGLGPWIGTSGPGRGGHRFGGTVHTRPGFTAVPWQEEWNRLKDVLPLLLRELDVPLSVDTFYPQVAEKALAAGAHIVNDVTGFGGGDAPGGGRFRLRLRGKLPPGGPGGRGACRHQGGFFQTRLEEGRPAGAFPRSSCASTRGWALAPTMRKTWPCWPTPAACGWGAAPCWWGPPGSGVTARGGGGGERSPWPWRDRLGPHPGGPHGGCLVRGGLPAGPRCEGGGHRRQNGWGAAGKDHTGRKGDRPWTPFG